MTEKRKAVDLEAMFPGRDVELKGANGQVLKLTVYPVGMPEFKRFSNALGALWGSLRSAMSEIKVKVDDSGKADLSKVMPMDVAKALLPHATQELMDMFAECVVGADLKRDRIPLYAIMPVFSEWIDYSFGSEEKLRPFVTVLEDLTEKVTGSRPDLWKALSGHMSKPDSSSETSTKSKSPAVPTGA